MQEGGAYLQITSTATVKHDFSQTFDISVQEHMNQTMTTPAPQPTTTPGPPTTSTESSCQREREMLASERDTYRGATIGLAVLAGVGALLMVAGVVTMMARSRRRDAVTVQLDAEKPHA